MKGKDKNFSLLMIIGIILLILAIISIFWIFFPRQFLFFVIWLIPKSVGDLAIKTIEIIILYYLIRLIYRTFKNLKWKDFRIRK